MMEAAGSTIDMRMVVGMNEVVRALRLVFAVLTIAAVFYQFQARDMSAGRTLNFFSFFTIQSNIIIAAVFLVEGLREPEREDSGRWAMVRAASAMYMATTGIVYTLLLSGLEAALEMTKPIVNAQLHVIMPIVAVLDLLLLPPNRMFRLRDVLAWTAYPLVYLGYSLIRGPIADWYPYPFLDPREPGGYGKVAVMCVVIFVAFIAFGMGVSWIINLRQRSRTVLPSGQLHGRGTP